MFFILTAVAYPAAEDSLDADSVSSDTNSGFAPKPYGALLRSLAVPGWGQYYNRKYIKGGLVTLLEGYFIYSLVDRQLKMNDYLDKRAGLATDSELYERYKNKYNEAKADRDTALWWWLGIKFLSVVDAYVDAHLFQFQEEVETKIGWGIRRDERGEYLCISLYF